MFEAFCYMARESKNLVLVAHNARAFDMRHLLWHVQLTNMLNQFCTVAIATSFGDSLPYLKDVYKGKAPGFKQSYLFSWVFGMMPMVLQLMF